jgi:hypothetical protein
MKLQGQKHVFFFKKKKIKKAEGAIRVIAILPGRDSDSWQNGLVCRVGVDPPTC